MENMTTNAGGLARGGPGQGAPKFWMICVFIRRHKNFPNPLASSAQPAGSDHSASPLAGSIVLSGAGTSMHVRR